MHCCTALDISQRTVQLLPRKPVPTPLSPGHTASGPVQVPVSGIAHHRFIVSLDDFLRTRKNCQKRHTNYACHSRVACLRLLRRSRPRLGARWQACVCANHMHVTARDPHIPHVQWGKEGDICQSSISSVYYSKLPNSEESHHISSPFMVSLASSYRLIHTTSTSYKPRKHIIL